VPPVATQHFTLTVVAALTNIVVQNTNDSGPGSLRAALANPANSQTITFSPGVTGRISLTSGQLVVSNGVTILGPGANVLAIDGKGSSRVFYISPGATVTIAGLTITNGSASGSIGGGIYNDHATTTVSNCTLTGNSAMFSGGGIYSDGSGGGATLARACCKSPFFWFVGFHQALPVRLC
jgi:predicted outer membrane repeat protein